MQHTVDGDGRLVFRFVGDDAAGVLTVPHDLSKKLPGQGVELLSVTAEHAEAVREFPELIRHDPFDRLIVAQASRAGLQLLTADHVLLELHRDFIIDASR